MTLDELKKLHESGEFHHATYREIGKVWEGLYIYRRAAGSPRGFDMVGCFNAYTGNPDLHAAEDFLRSIRHGVSVGSFGNG